MAAYKEIFGIVPRENTKDIWTRIGVGFPNKDGSINMKFDYIPTGSDVRIQMRDPRPRDEEEA